MKKYIFYVISSLLLFSSCSSQLDVTPPNAITDEQISELLASGDATTINKILGSMANAMPTQFNNSSVMDDLAYDVRYAYINGLDVMRNLEGNDIVLGTAIVNSFCGGGDEYDLVDFHTYTSPKNLPYWNNGWKGIVAANKLLAYLSDDVVGSNALLKEYKGRGLIARAWFYNYLMENYQDAYLQGGKSKLGMMLYDTYDPSQEYKARSTSEETYAFIKKDLNAAIKLYQEAGVGFTSNVYDLDLGVAYFILARVSLWTGDYATCISCCNAIMAQKPTLIGEAAYGSRIAYTSDGVLNVRPEKNAFLNNAVNPEVLFGWDASADFKIFGSWMNCFSPSFLNTHEYGASADACQRIDNRLYEKIADNDYRKDCFMLKAFGDYNFPNRGVHYIPSYTNIKFAANYGLGTNNTSDAGMQSFCNFRTSEVLLMLAESQSMSGDEAGAKASLNKLLAARTRSGATTLTCDNYPSMSGMTTLQKIQLQWRIEMWGENGREFYNNKRWNIPVNRASSANHVVKGTLSVSDMTLQIPEDEMLYNPKIVQN